MEEKIRVEIIKKAADGKLTCAAARKIAEDAGVPYSEVGAAADELGIRIRSCQLGCF